MSSKTRLRRLPLSSSRRRLSYERRVRLWLLALAVPPLGLSACFIYQQSLSTSITVGCILLLAAVWAIASAYFFEQIVRPLQTLANVVAALREDDFSFRARGALRGDSMGDLALEINALASMMQEQQTSARDALTLAERVMSSMQSPVLAFDPAGHLQLINPAAERGFELDRDRSLGRAAEELGLATLLDLEDLGLYSRDSAASPHAERRWSVRKTTFRLHGVPHTLLVLTDVAAALREEERLAWQRLIRVLSHEVNNSLTPIKSIAGSLRTRLPQIAAELETMSNQADFHRGLTVIEERAASLNRFLQAYQQLTRLPAPRLQPIWFDSLVEQAAHLETRLAVTLEPGPRLPLLGDPDQLQQLLINLIANAVEAALSSDAVRRGEPAVVVSWSTSPDKASVVLQIRDNGPGLTNPSNLFVPFYTTKPEGSGIGLVLAQQIASAHKGTVALFNNAGGTGCTAELRLPLE